MAKLILGYQSLQLKEIDLDQPRYSIGRDPACDLCIDDPQIEAQHAMLGIVGAGYQFQDMTQAQRVSINEETPGRRILGDGDVIRLGADYYLIYRTLGPILMRRQQAMPVPGAAANMAAAFSSLPAGSNPPPAELAHMLGTMGSPLAAAPPSTPPPLTRLGAIRVVSGNNAGKTLMLAKELSRLGTPGVQVVAISRKPEGYFFTHVEGVLVPRLNGKEIASNAPYPLKDRDVIDIQGTRLEFFIVS